MKKKLAIAKMLFGNVMKFKKYQVSFCRKKNSIQ